MFIRQWSRAIDSESSARIAAAMAEEIGREVAYRPGGATRAAVSIGELL
jgi:hypothetical protein